MLSDKDLQAALKARESHPESLRAAAKSLGVAHTTLQGRLERAREKFPEQAAHKTNDKQPKLSEEELFNNLIDWEEFLRTRRVEQESTDQEITTDLPIGIAFLSDQHIGNVGTHHMLVKATLDWVLNTPFLFCTLNGDVIDNFVSHSHETGRYEQALRPKDQKRLAAWLAEQLSPRLIAVTGGQHEFFEERVSDFDSAEYFAHKGNAAYLGAGGAITLKVGQQTYRIGMWHRYRGNSIYDKNADAKRLCREHGPFAITVTGDKHEPAISYCLEQDEFRVFVRGGTCKLEDRYAKSLGYQGRVGTPLVILWPDERKFWVTLDFEGGCQYLRFLRHKPM